MMPSPSQLIRPVGRLARAAGSVRAAGRHGLLGLLLGWLAVADKPVQADTVLLTNNFANILNQSFDAVSFVNFNTVNVSNFSSALYSTRNTLNYTNALTGLFSGDVGFQFDLVTNLVPGNVENLTHIWAGNVINQGTIQGDQLLLSATNINNSGDLLAGNLLQMQGSTVSVSRSKLSAVVLGTNFTSDGFRSVNTNGRVSYQNPNLAADVYWGAGTGNVMSVRQGGAGLFLPTLNTTNFGLMPPQIATPSHEVQQLSSVFLGNFNSFNSLSGTNYQPFVRRTQQGTNVTVQVVLVQTNGASTNLFADVRFGFFGGANFVAQSAPVVRFSAVGSDITTGQLYTNSVYLFDYTGSQTNSTLSDYQLSTSSSRPANYDFRRSSYWDTYFSTAGAGATSNAVITSNFYYQAGFQLDTVTNNFYSAWQVAVGNASFGPGSPGYDVTLDDPTNLPGRVEITANDLDLSYSRIQADGIVSIRAPNLTSSVGTKIDSAFIQLAIANTNTTLTLTNFAGASVARPNGLISAYSTTWTNVFTNASPQLTFRYSVLVVDASQLSGLTPVTLQAFNVRGTNVIINNDLNIGREIEIDSPAVTFTAASSLNLPLSGATNISSTNFPNVSYFTNLGVITVPYDCTLGSDRAAAITSFINGGTLVANNISIRAVDFQSTGTNQTRGQAGAGTGGPISILANTAKLDGGSGGGLLAAGGSILLAANDLKIRNHRLTTAGSLVINVTNTLTDTGSAGTNRFEVALGFSQLARPLSGDLLGTTIYSTVPVNRSVPHVWAAADLGPWPAGYTNNSAVGRLLLDSTTTDSLNRFAFSGLGTSNALYVDYLELTGTITNDLATHLFIDTNMMIYFANANVPVQALDGQLGGRLRWVKDFAGPNTGVDYRLPDGRTVKVNVAKLNSLLLDSDADGVVNGSDLSPFDGVTIKSQVTFTNVPPLTAYISWEAAAQSVYQIEVNTNLLTGSWQLLRLLTNSANTNRVLLLPDVVPPGSTERYYRVGYQP